MEKKPNNIYKNTTFPAGKKEENRWKKNQITSTRTQNLTKTMTKFVMIFVTKATSEVLIIIGEKSEKTEKIGILRK